MRKHNDSIDFNAKNQEKWEIANMIIKKRLLSIILCLSLLFCSCFAFSACNHDRDESDVPPVSNFTISFVVDGEVYATITTTRNEKITLPSDPQKAGQTFNGWFSDKDIWTDSFNEDSLLDLHLTTDLQVYAFFIPNDSIDGSLGLKYTFDEKVDGYIVKGIGSCVDTEIIIPTTYNSKPVIGIAEAAFADCINLLEITVPQGIKAIPYRCFEGCTSLKRVILHEGLLTIGADAFRLCENVESINLPNSLTSIGGSAWSSAYTYNNAFSDCHKIMTEENSVYYIGNWAIKGTSINITNISIREGTVGIAEEAFSQSALITVSLPNSIKYIGIDAFSQCDNLQYNRYDNGYYLGNAEYPYMHLNKVTNKEIISLVLSDHVKTVDNWALYRCPKLTRITIPKSMTDLGECPFYGCKALESIIVEEGNTRYHSEGNCLIETATKTLVSGCKNSIIPSDGSVTTIGYGAFWDCSTIQSIIIPKEVTSIEGYAFCWSGVKTMMYEGTIEEWEKIKTGDNWNSYSPIHTVICSNGSVSV